MAAKSKLNVHNFPRPPLLEQVPSHLVIRWNGQALADTKSAYWVLETTHPPSRFDCLRFTTCKEEVISCLRRNPTSTVVILLEVSQLTTSQHIIFLDPPFPTPSNSPRSPTNLRCASGRAEQRIGTSRTRHRARQSKTRYGAMNPQLRDSRRSKGISRFMQTACPGNVSWTMRR